MIFQDLENTVFRAVFLSLFILKILVHFNLIYYKNNIKFKDLQSH